MYYLPDQIVVVTGIAVPCDGDWINIWYNMAEICKEISAFSFFSPIKCIQMSVLGDLFAFCEFIIQLSDCTICGKSFVVFLLLSIDAGKKNVII